METEATPEEIFNNDYKISKEQKETVNKDIEHWNDMYDGKGYPEIQNHSKIVWKLIQKQGETLMANLSKPFISGCQNIMVTPVTSKDVYKAKIDEGLLNHYHDKVLDKNRFYKELSRVMVKEGTAWIRVGWNKVNKRKSIEVPNIPPEAIPQLEANGFEIVQKNGKIYIEKDNIITNEPEAKVLKNGRVYTDPIASTGPEMKFLIYEYEISPSDLRKQSELYDEGTVDKVVKNLTSYQAPYFEDIAGTPDSTDGFRNYASKGNRQVKLYEWWGDYDIDKDGITIPCVMVFGGDGKDKVLMSIKKNPYPFKKIPFVEIPCIIDLYSVWGKAIAYLIEDIQYVYTMLMRGVLDNTAGSNNAQKFVKKGALDSTNMNRLMNKEPLVEVNTTESINTAVMDGGFNEIPNTIFNLFGMLDQEAEAMTGISKMMQGVTGAHMNAAASNFSATLSMSQMRLLDITHNVSFGMKRVLEMWISMALEYLDEDEIQTITGIDIDQLKIKETQILMQQYQIEQLPPDVAQNAQMIIMEEVDDMFNKKDLEYDIRMKIGTDGLKEVRINQLNMLMQQMGGLANMVDPMILKDLLAEYADLMDFPATADKIREYVPQPDPMAQQAQQLELAKLGGEAQKEQALADNASARAEQVRSETQNRGAGLDAEIAGKYANVAKTYSDIENSGRDADTKEFEAGAKAGNESRKITEGSKNKGGE